MDQAPLFSPFAPGQIVARKYELVRLIGAGGMGEVWEAHHFLLGAQVAIKFALERRAREPIHVQRFRREARALARLTSPDIVKVFDVGEHDNYPYLVMELLEGESLKALLEREGLLPLRAAAELTSQVARALSVIHRAGMVHRDVTPGNLFLLAPTPEFPSLRVKILDFGVAKTGCGDAQITASGALVGSPAYMSPEQARAEDVDARSDLWSLAAVLYRCVTGADAFSGSSITEVLFQICTGELPSATKANPELPAEFDGFFERAFARNRRFRFDTAIAMAEAVRVIANAHLTPDEPGIEDELPITRARFRDSVTTSFAQSRLTTLRQRNTSMRYWGLLVLSAGISGTVLLFLALREDPQAPSPAASSTLPHPSPTMAKVALVTAVAAPSSHSKALANAPAPPTFVPATRQLPKAKLAEVLRSKQQERRPSTASNGKPATAKVDPLFGLPVKNTDYAETNRTGAVPSNDGSLH